MSSLLAMLVSHSQTLHVIDWHTDSFVATKVTGCVLLTKVTGCVLLTKDWRARV